MTVDFALRKSLTDAHIKRKETPFQGRPALSETKLGITCLGNFSRQIYVQPHQWKACAVPRRFE